jgi:hypothetical protein
MDNIKASVNDIRPQSPSFGRFENEYVSFLYRHIDFIQMEMRFSQLRMLMVYHLR